MFRPRFIPVLLLKNQGLVKTIQFRKPKYIGDPLNAVQIFNKFKTDELVFLDINASKEGRTIDLDLVKEIGDEAFMPFAVGGGINSLKKAEELINAGAEKVVLNTSLHTDLNLISQIASIFGSQSIIVSIDVKKNLYGKNKVYIKSGSKKTGTDPVKFAKIVESCGAGEILITSIAHEGMMNGLNINLINSIHDAVSIPIIAHGGVNSLNHFKEGVKNGASAVAAGSFFVYSGKQNGILINYPSKKEMKNIFKK